MLERIEATALEMGATSANWQVNTQTLTVDFGNSSLTKEELLKKIAEVGHDNELFKTCTICGEKLPKTEEYFNVKIIKQQNQSRFAIYHSFRHACKKCLNEKIAKYKRDEYWKDPEKAREELKRKYWKDPEKARRKRQEWRDRNLEYLHKKDRKRVSELDDSWVASKMKIPKTLLNYALNKKPN